MHGAITNSVGGGVYLNGAKFFRCRKLQRKMRGTKREKR